MTNYPGAIDEFRTVQNLPGILYNAADLKTVYAEDANAHSSAISAIETTLGANPQGAYESVVDRLNHNNDVKSYLSVNQTGLQIVSGSGWVTVNLTNIVNDAHGLWNATTSTGTFTEDGLYYCEASMWYANSVDTSDNKVIIFVDGTDIAALNKPQTAAFESRPISRTFYAEAGMQFSLGVQQSTGSDCYIDAYPSTVYLTLYKVGNV